MLYSEAPGVQLQNLNLTELNSAQLLGTMLEITSQWQRAQNVIGSKFTHWDFHPENIFVDFSHKARKDIAIPFPKGMPTSTDWTDASQFIKLDLQFPTVTVIDFDLVSSSVFPLLLSEHEAKEKSAIGITERALQWLPPTGLCF